MIRCVVALVLIGAIAFLHLRSLHQRQLKKEMWVSGALFALAAAGVCGQFTWAHPHGLARPMEWLFEPIGQRLLGP
ncbi:hypothetical protein [Alicyclobacillus macrosporangiidus]|uniref:hypothetical protein n=1 Tax=Alicyclobacillus macrosporangiidus TaxID=392015 RepID=UPI000496BC59|nr:hypothetical protein [Alicyclobacillus macrosporangiidus]MCL6600656.1 hypothetical protein [Alicyclobacillus macrosporangiidus]